MLRPVAVGVEDAGGHEARAERGDADLRACGCQFVVEGLGDCGHGVLGGVVGPDLRKGRVSRHRCGDDNVAVVLFQQAAEVDVQAVDHAPEVDAQDPLPVSERPLDHQPATGHPRVQAYHVGSTEPGVYFCGEGPEGPDVGHVTLATEDLCSSLPEVENSPVQGVLLYVADGHLHARCGEPVGESQAHARGASGDDDDLAVQVSHVGTPACRAQRSSSACSTSSGMAGWM